MDPNSASRRDLLGLLGAPASNGAAAEIPVLFRVTDVSTPPAITPPPAKKTAPPTQLKAPLPDKLQQVVPPAVITPPPAPSKPAVASPVVAPVASSEAPAALATPAEPSPAAPSPKSDSLGEALAAPAPAADNPTTVTPADRRRAREEQAQVKGDDWLATHGKLIAMGFVAALLITIVAARYRQPQSVKPKPDQVASGPSIEMPAPASPTQPAVALSTEPPSVAIKPAAPPASKTPDSPLFPWAEEQLRTAQRSAAPELAPAQTPEPEVTAESAPPLTAPELPSPPEAPFAPSPAAPAENQPPSDGPQPNYPVTGYGDTFQLTPAQGGSQSNNSPSGIRNERTGSGLY
jgi:hypothetical protein